MKTKKELIGFFETIEDDSIRFFSDQSRTKAVEIISKLNVFAKILSEHLNAIMEEEDTDRILLDKTKNALLNITAPLFNVMQYFNRIASEETLDLASCGSKSALRKEKSLLT